MSSSILIPEAFDKLKVIQYEDRYAPDFIRLNREWLEGFGLLEDADAKHLNSPRESIIDPGGQIFLAVEKETVLGTCAAIRHSIEVVEIAKLAVTPSAQRRGIGRLLTQTAIEYAHGMGAQKVSLVSSTKLGSALKLYESMGFISKSLPEQLDYISADVYMELVLSDNVSNGR
ncbi:MAG: MarR family transcriptional regulator [Deltaproteobacteria bacterium]|nr:MAG: MarR family transcriptional regulator [Deltaproteobacteria bacterium]